MPVSAAMIKNGNDNYYEENTDDDDNGNRNDNSCLSFTPSHRLEITVPARLALNSNN